MINTNKDNITHSLEQNEHSRNLASNWVENEFCCHKEYSLLSFSVVSINAEFGFVSTKSGKSTQAVPIIPTQADESWKSIVQLENTMSQF